MKEIEILVEILSSDKAFILSKLDKFNFVEKKKVIDTYFYDPKRPDLQPNELGNLSRCFRLRKKDDITYIAYKIDHFDSMGKWVYSDEYECSVEDYSTIKELITLLNFEILVVVDNEKHVYITDKYEIVFEDVANLGYFLEVELKDTRDMRNVENIKKEIWKFIESLGLSVSSESIYGKPELLLRKKKAL